MAVALMLLLTASAQTSYHITTGQGLATNQLTALIKDRQNNMWFGSYNGLHKHEGTSIKVYKKSGKDSTSLSSKEMHVVFEDRLGFIWAGTTGGLDKLDPKTGIIFHYKLKSSSRTDDWIGYIVTIFQDDKDNIWVHTEAGFFLLNYQTGKYSEILTNEKTGKGMPSDGLIYKSAIETSDGIWMYAPGYLMFYDFKSHQFFHKYNNPFHKKAFELPEAVSPDSQSDLCIDSANNLYFILNGTFLIRYNINADKLDSFHFVFPENAWKCCYSIAADYKGNIWIGFRYGGLLFFNSNNQQFTPIRYTDANSLIQSDYIYSLAEDYLKRMWVTTDNGIFIINYYDSTVQQKYLSDKKGIINIDYPSAIISEDDRGNIYVPFYSGGLFTYNVFSGNSRHSAVTDMTIKDYGYVFTKEKSKLYVSSKGTLLQADTSGNKIKLETSPEKKYKLLAETPGRVVWVFRYNEKAVYFKKGNGIIYYYNGTDHLEKIETTGFTKQACVSNDNRFLYFLAENGDLIKRDLISLAMDTFFLNKKLQAFNFSYSNTRDVADDGNGNIWITSQNGLIKYNSQSQQVTVYTTSDGLLHDFSFTICVDSKKRVWVGSMAGVNLYDAQKNTFINVFPELPDKLSNYFGSSLEGKDGHIYFLFGSKLVNINPDKFFKQKIEDRLLRVNEVQVNGKPVNLSTNILSCLSYQQNRIYFRFGLLEFAQPEKVNYYYRLQGLGNNWIDLGNHSEITFNSLPPGDYSLFVKATDVYGNEVKEQLIIPFIIKPPFWKTWWFISLIVVMIVLLTFLFIRWREKNIKAIGAEKLKSQQARVAMHSINEQLSKARLEALRSQMNPHFIFNSLNAIQECVVTGKVDAAYEYLSKFSKLQRLVLNNSAKELIPLGTEVEMLQLYLSLESLRFSKSFQYEINIDATVDPDEVLIPSLITQPYVENAIWHGLRNKEGDKRVSISFKEISGQLIISIDDNGIGREKAEKIKEQKMTGSQHASRGSALSLNRVSLLNQQLKTDIRIKYIDKKDAEGFSSGTTLLITLSNNLSVLNTPA